MKRLVDLFTVFHPRSGQIDQHSMEPAECRMDSELKLSNFSSAIKSHLVITICIFFITIISCRFLILQIFTDQIIHV